jgi:hypothetical protein
MTSYIIVKYEYPNPFVYTEVIKTGLTEAQAQEHCQRDDTHKEGKWFHGYIKTGEKV